MSVDKSTQDLGPAAMDMMEVDLRAYWAIVRRWLWLIAACAALGAGAAFAVSSQMTPIYEASATLLVQQAPSGRSNDYQDLLTSERLARTYSEMVKRRPVIEQVIEDLDLNERVETLAERLDVALVRDTQLIELTVEDTDPGRAAEIANSVAEAFIAQNASLEAERYAESMASMERQMNELSTLVEETEEKIEGLSEEPGTEGDEEALTRLETALAGYRNSYSALLQTYEELRVTSTRSSNDVVLYEEARAPQRPVRPQTLMNTGLAGVVGGMLGLGGVFLVEFLDDTVKTPDEVAEVTGLGTLGTIGEMEEGETELVTLERPLSPLSEAFRSLRTNIRYSGVDDPVRTILVTSPGAVEGKSTVVSNLAVAMAQAELKVVVLDADLRRPRQHELFGGRRSPGLTEWLLNGHVERTLRRVGQPSGLTVLPAGEVPPNPAEILGTQRMGKMLERLRDLVDVVIIDSPPVLPVTDAAVLAQHVDGVVMVVEAGKTKREMLAQAVDRLRQVGARPIGVVLNRVPSANGGAYGYYYCDSYYEDGKTDQVGMLERVAGRWQGLLDTG